MLQTLIPASPGIWLIFFILPAAISLVGQVILCRKSTLLSLRLIPLYVAGILLLCVLLYRFTGFLAPLIGGFVALCLLGTAGFILVASALGWLIDWMVERH